MRNNNKQKERDEELVSEGGQRETKRLVHNTIEIVLLLEMYMPSVLDLCK